MCKYFIGKNNIQPRIAESDIPVFKGVELIDNGKRWAGLYRHGYSAATGRVLKAEGDANINRNGDLWICVEGGMFHSCTDLNAFKPRRSDISCRHSIVRAIIPKGTKYFVSKVGNDICSEKLVVTNEEIVNFNAVDKYSEKFTDMFCRATVEIVDAEGKEWMHIKNNEHEVFLALKSLGSYDWRTAQDKAKEYGGVLPNTDDWDLVNKYRHQIDPILDHLPQAHSLESWYWSLSEAYYDDAWYYYGYTGSFHRHHKVNSSVCRPVLALAS